MFDLTSDVIRAQVANRIHHDVEAASVRDFEEGHRSHMGASIMGKPCKRQHWSTFRWLKQEKFSGRMHRLFKRGHREEPHIIERLRAAGFTVYEHDPETGKQFRIVGAKGHYGGSGDGLGYCPPEYGINEAIVFEFKTHKEKWFAKLAGKILAKTPEIRRGKPEGVKKTKPEHYAQMCQYGKAYNLRYGLYVAINKETDEYYFEFVELDWTLADRLFRDAEYLIFSQVPPPKIAESIAFYDCKYCVYGGICHAGQQPEKNCRSCINARPVDNGEWWCDLHSPEANSSIPNDTILVGCPSWKSIV